MYKTPLTLFFLLLFKVSLVGQSASEKYAAYSYKALDSLVNELYAKGQYQECLYSMQAARKKARQEFGKQDSLYALYTSNLGFFHKLKGNFYEAKKLYQEALPIQAAVQGKEHQEYASTLNNMATLLMTMGALDEALILTQEALILKEKIHGKKHLKYLKTLNNLAYLEEEMGNLEVALSIYLQVIDLKASVIGKESTSYARSLNNLASLYKVMGDINKAFDTYHKTIDIYRKIMGEKHPGLANAYNNLALYHQDIGNYDEALKLQLKSKQIWHYLYGDMHPKIALSYNNLGWTHLKLKNYKQAIDYCEKSLAIYAVLFGNIHPRYLNTQNNLAKTWAVMGQHQKALLEVNDILIHCQLNIQVHDFSKQWLDSLSAVSFGSQKQLNNTIIALQTAYLVLSNSPKTLNRHERLMNIVDAVHLAYSKSINLMVTEEDKLRQLKLHNRWLLKTLSIFKKEKHSKAFERIDNMKSVLLHQATQSEQLHQKALLPDSLIWQDKRLKKLQVQYKARLYESYSSKLRDSLSNLLDEVNIDMIRFKKLLKNKYPDYYRLRYSNKHTKTKAIQQLLDPKTALLEFVIADSFVHILVVDKKQVRWEKTRVNKSVLSNNINLFHHSLSNYKLLTTEQRKNNKDYLQNAYWLYQKLLEAALKNTDYEHLILVTDGELGNIPFESLLTKAETNSNYKDLQYLIKDYSISYSYAASIWRENKEAKKMSNNGEILALASEYVYEPNNTKNDRLLKNNRILRQLLSPLPGAVKEVHDIEKIYKGTFLYHRSASEKMVKKLAPDYAVLHFATHGIIDKNRPMLSAVALTEDYDSLENNFLQAYEISGMSLKADLVVLSACETGYGKFETGNGIASLARSFMYAGAPALVMSLWQVNDRATSVIMQKFYEKLSIGMPKDKALQEAKLHYLQTSEGIFTHPAFWSPFVVIGDSAPIALKSKQATMPWILSGLIAAGILGIGLIRRYRHQKVA